MMIVKPFLTHWNTSGDIDAAGHRKGSEGDVGIGEGDMYGMCMIWLGTVLNGNSVFCQLRWNEKVPEFAWVKYYLSRREKGLAIGSGE